VIAAPHRAGVDSHADEPGRPHAQEQGGGIYLNHLKLATGEIVIRRGDPRATVVRTTSTSDARLLWLARFHTHPARTEHSDVNQRLAEASGIPGCRS
jgi:hypothetical protein